MSVHRALRRATTAPFFILAVLVVLFEETFWGWMTAFGHWLAPRLPLFALVEWLVARLSPRATFAVFLIPLVALAPFGFVGAWLGVHGHIGLAVLVEVVVKLVSGAVAARIFAIARPKLMLVPGFVRLHAATCRLLDRAHAYVDNLAAWQTTKVAVRGALAGAKHGVLRLRFMAARRLAKRSV